MGEVDRARVALVDATARTYRSGPSRTRRRTIALSAVLACIAAFVVPLVSTPLTVAADVEVERTGDDVRFTVRDRLEPYELREALASADVDAQVEEVASPPFLEGQIVSIVAGATEVTDGRGRPITTGVLRAGGSVLLRVGREAKADEGFAVFVPANLPGAPLACVDVRGATPALLLSELDRLGMTEINVAIEPADLVTGGELDGAVVQRAHWVSPRSIVVGTAPVGVETPLPEECV